METKKIYPREKYLSRIRPFYDSDVVKVITGIRRCGKSCILQTIVSELERRNLGERIIYLPLDKRGYKDIKTPEKLEQHIEAQIKDDAPYYLFIDEVQNVKGFESIVLQYEEEGYSVFLTGSNSYLLSDEISTKLTGRYLTFEVFPLDFCEYLEMKRFFGKPINEDLYREFDEYLVTGGFPKALEFEGSAARQTYTKGIIGEIFQKDIKTRNRISNVPLFERVQSYVINNYGATFSLSSVCEAVNAAGLHAKQETIQKYIDILKKAKIIRECNRFDLKSKKSIAREQKFYLTDLSLYFSTNVDNQMNYGPSLENMVYLYLVSNGYAVSIGKIGKLECDFIVRTPEGEYAYIQVTYSMTDNEQVKEREFKPFREIRDGYPRYIISLDRLRDQQEGVHHLNAIDVFLHKESL